MLSKTKPVLIEIASDELLKKKKTVDQYIRSKFEGRKKVLNRFIQKLENAEGATGVYLITGYRGVGKTRFVEEALKKAQQNPNEIRIVNLSLSQNEVTEHGLLRQMALSLVEEIEVSTSVDTEILKNSNPLFLLLIFIIGLFTYPYIHLIAIQIINNIWIDLANTPNKYLIESIIATLIIYQTSFILTCIFIKRFLTKKIQQTIFNQYNNRKNNSTKTYNFLKFKRTYSKILNTLATDTRIRLFSSIVKESNKSDSNETLINMASSVLTGKLSTPYAKSRQISQSNILSTKELESLLIKLINHYQWYNAKYLKEGFRQIVFVIDELDKIEPSRDIAPLSEKQSVQIDINTESKTKAQQRQQTITRLLANLKNFTHNIDAISIFIGGRGMYDASLADIADRESFYSSVFDDIFYINSLFKDRLTENGGMSELIDSLLFSILNISNVNSLKNLNSHMEYSKALQQYSENNDTKSMLSHKINHIIQNYITFLTYRSNGTPKKFIELISKRVVKYPTKVIQNSNHEIEVQESSHIILFGNGCIDVGNIIDDESNDHQHRYFLEFDARNQYLINLTSRLYRPYMLGGTRYLKSLSDKLLYSGAFLIDHIVKFHRNSFEYQDLELIPDTVLINQDANFRFFFKDILNLFLRNDLRITLNGMSQYKFNSLTANEFKFASRVSESSSAAFNFTLDQSFHLKSYYKRILISKQQEYKINPSSTQLIHSISYLRSILGDLHFYDAQYRDAVQYYTDSIQPFREYLSGNIDTKPTHQYVLYTKNKLKLGLSLERLFSYDKAYSIYRSLTLELDRFIPSNTVADNWELPYKSMQLFSRPYISLLGVIEKQRQDGITTSNLHRNLESYCKFLGINENKLFPINDSYITLDFKYDTWNKDITLSNNNSKIHVKGFSNSQKQLPKTNRSNPFNQDRKRIIALLVDYYISTSDLLYYKNRLIFSIFKKPRHLVSSSKIYKKVKRQKKVNDTTYRPAIISYQYYIYALRLFIEPYIENMINDDFNLLKHSSSSKNITSNIKTESSLLISITYFLGNYSLNSLNSHQHSVLSSLLSKTSDAVFSFVSKNETLEDLHKAIDLFHEDTSLKKFKNIFTDPKNTTNFIIICIACSALSYRVAIQNSDTSTALIQLKRVLHICRVILLNRKKHSSLPLNSNNSLIASIQKLFNKYYINLIKSSQVSTRDELFKYQSFSFDLNEPYLYLQLSDSHDARTMLFLYHDILDSLIPKRNTSFDRIINYFKSGLTSSSSMYSQIATLTFLYRHYTKDILSIRNKKYSLTEFRKITNDPSAKQCDLTKYVDLLLSFTNKKLTELADAIYVVSETERILSLYDINYIFSYSYRFDTSRRLGELSRIYLLLDHISKLPIDQSNLILQYNQNPCKLKKFEEFKNSMKKFEFQMKKLLGDRYKLFLNEFKHYDAALYHFDQAKSLHTEGSVYREQIKDMYILDDDYNDLFMHFCTAYERYRLHSKSLEKSAKKIQDYLKEHSNMYNMHNLLGSSS